MCIFYPSLLPHANTQSPGFVTDLAKEVLRVVCFLGLVFKINSVDVKANLVGQKYPEAHRRLGVPQIRFDLQQTCTTESLKQP